MREKPVIQKLLAAMLLVFFTISTAPKTIFHELLANHQDVISCEHPGKEATCVHQEGYSCHFDDLVVTTPYVTPVSGYSFLFSEFFPSYISRLTQLLLLQYSKGAESRGPPAVVA